MRSAAYPLGMMIWMTDQTLKTRVARIHQTEDREIAYFGLLLFSISLMASAFVALAVANYAK